MTKRRNSDLLLLLPGRTNPESFQLEDKPQSVTHTHTHTHTSLCVLLTQQLLVLQTSSSSPQVVFAEGV